jgi:hypothetical protein
MLRALLRAFEEWNICRRYDGGRPHQEASAVDNSKNDLEEVVQIRVQPFEDL